MSNTNSLSVAVIGISPHEQGVLQRIFGLTSFRSRSYVLVPLTTDHTPDIFLVDGDTQDAVAEWRALCASSPDHAVVPTVLVSKASGVAATQRYHLLRPLLAPRVLKLLDTVDVTRPAVPLTLLQPHKVLVVDDSETVRKQVELELRELGIETDIAANGNQAFAYLKSSVLYDIIFLDVVLPDVDGYTICKSIRKDKHRKQTPVVMLTGKDSPFDRVRGKLAGCDIYLTKPVSRESFRVVVKQCLPDVPRKEVAIG